MKNLKRIVLTLAVAIFALIANAQTATVYSWDGNGISKEENFTAPTGGTATPMGGDANIVAGAKQKNNWCFKLGKGYLVEEVQTHYVEIALDNALKGGEEIAFNAFMTSEGKEATFGIDFDGANELTYAVEEVITENGVPSVEGKLTVPVEAAGCSKVRIFRKKGNTTVYVSKLIIASASEAEEGKATISNVSLSVAEGEQIDSDGDFKVTLNYAISINDPAIAEHSNMVSAGVAYTVYDAANNVVDSGKDTPTISATTRNLYASGLEGGKEYTLKVDKFYVIDKVNADYETNFGDTLVVINNCAEIKFTPVAAVVKRVDVKDMKMTYDATSFIDNEGDYTLTFNYTGKINDESIKAEDLYSVIKYQVYDDQFNFVTSGERDFSFEETSRNVYVSGLTAGKSYMFVVSGLVIKTVGEELLNLTSDLPKLNFKVRDPNAPQAISMSSMSFSIAEGEKIEIDDEDKIGYYKVTFNYTATVNDASAVTFPYASINWEVTDQNGEKVVSKLSDFDCNSASKNIYLPNLEDGKTYTITATSIDIQDLASMEMLCQISKDLPSLTFTVGGSTGISAATVAQQQVVKTIENNKIVILKNGRKFGLNAVEVK